MGSQLMKTLKRTAIILLPWSWQHHPCFIAISTKSSIM